MDERFGDTSLGRVTGLAKRVPSRLLEAACRPLLGTVYAVRTSERVAALTFDDGPDPQATPNVLDLLARHGARATFFMRGVAAAANPDLVRLAAEAGHAIGNHTWDHPSMPNIERIERREQILDCARALAPHGSRLFRPPYGHQSRASRLDALLLGYRVIGWSGHAFDYLDRGPEQIAAGLTEKLKPGAILLLHDALYPPVEPRFADRGALLEGLERFLAGPGGGYRFVTVPELLRLGRPRLKTWLKPGDIGWLNTLNDGATRQYTEPEGRRTGRSRLEGSDQPAR